MAFKLPDRVLETFTTTGTGTVTLAGAVSGYKTFASELSNADTCFYFMTGGADYEFGRGTYSGVALARTSILGSSNADAAVNWAAGTKIVGIAPIGPSDMDATALAAFTGLLLGAGTTLLPLARLASYVLSGCILSNNGSDATNDIDISAGYVVSDDGAAVMQVAAITKRLDAAWAVGTGNGGLDTGSIANATYHMWAIQRADTLVVDVLFSTSASAPTMPANYGRKAYIGSIVRSSAAIRAFKQDATNPRRFRWVTTIVDRSSTSAVALGALTVSVPSGIVVEPIFAIQLNSAAASQIAVELQDADASSGAERVAQSEVDAAVAHVVDGGFRSNTSAQIRFSTLIFSGTIATNDLRTMGFYNNNIKRLDA